MNQFSRTELLIGKESVEKLKNSFVAVIGLGGVGAITAESLVRSGVGKILLADFDKISITNINRQIMAFHSTVGKYKTDALKERFLDINPNLEIEIFSEFCAKETYEKILHNVDFVVDAIDNLTPKADLIEYLYHKKTPFISAMGAANRLDPSKIEICDISKTNTCPLAARLRKYLRKRDIYKGFDVVYSYEKPLKKIVEEDNLIERGRSRKTLGSIMYLPAIVGLFASSYVIKKIVEI